jgi:WD40 repeat protein
MVNGIILFGKLISRKSFDRSISVFDTSSGKKIVRIPNAHHAAVSVIAYDDDSQRIISGGFDKRVKIWNQDGTVIFDVEGFK